MKRYIYILTTLAALFFIVSCGIKPDAVEPPPGANEESFPRTYPDLSTDPQPHSH